MKTTTTNTAVRRTRGRPKGRPNQSLSGKSISFGPLGDLLRTRRHALGLGLADVASACQCSVQFVSNMEHGRAPLPWDKVDAVAKVLKVQSDQLQAANLTIRSDFKGFMGASAVGPASSKRGLIKGQVLGAARGTASAVTLAARDRSLQELLVRYQSASAAERKRFIQSALSLLPRT